MTYHLFVLNTHDHDADETRTLVNSLVKNPQWESSGSWSLNLSVPSIEDAAMVHMAVSDQIMSVSTSEDGKTWTKVDGYRPREMKV